MRIIMMGTGPFAVPTLMALDESAHQVVALFTRPSRPARGRRGPPPNPMREFATTAGIDVHDPEDGDSEASHSVIRSLQPELLVVCDYGQILSADTLALAHHNGLNLHASLLPKYRGAAPINWAIYHGETVTGNTVIHMTPKVDAGPCIAQEKTAIGPDETAVELEARMAQSGAQLVLRAIEMLESGNVHPIPQDDAQATRARRLRKTDGQIDWIRSAEQLCNQIRAMQPWPKTFTYWPRGDAEPLRLIVEKAHVVPASQTARPGEVLVAGADELLVSTGKDALALDQIQPAGKRILTVAEFLRGYPVQCGQLFSGQS